MTVETDGTWRTDDFKFGNAKRVGSTAPPSRAGSVASASVKAEPDSNANHGPKKSNLASVQILDSDDDNDEDTDMPLRNSSNQSGNSSASGGAGAGPPRSQNKANGGGVIDLTLDSDDDVPSRPAVPSSSSAHPAGQIPRNFLHYNPNQNKRPRSAYEDDDYMSDAQRRRYDHW